MIGNPPGQPVKPGSMGRPLPGYSVALLDADGVSGDEGEICVALEPRPVGLMAGYLDDPGKTAEVMRDGYYHTGDVATRDADGYITYVGRADDVFKCSDYRISPFELESVLIEHAAVAEAAVVPSPDPMRLAVPKAFVVLAAGVAPDAAHGARHPALVRAARAAVQAHPPARVRGAAEDHLGQDPPRRAAAPRARATGRRARRAAEFWEEDFPGAPLRTHRRAGLSAVPARDPDAALSFVSGTSDAAAAVSHRRRGAEGGGPAAPNRLALVVPYQSLRYTLRGIRSRGGAAGARLDCVPARAGRAHRHLGAELRGVDVDHVRGGARRPRLGEHQSGLPYSELEFALRVVGCRALVFAPRFKSSDYAAMLGSLIPELASAAPGQLECAAFPELRLAVQLGHATECRGHCRSTS